MNENEKREKKNDNKQKSMNETKKSENTEKNKDQEQLIKESKMIYKINKDYEFLILNYNKSKENDKEEIESYSPFIDPSKKINFMLKFPENAKYCLFYNSIYNFNDMICLFMNYNSLIDFEVQYFNIDNILNIESMFCNCSSLVNLNLSKFNIKQIKYMNSSFENRISL
jgi:surface protein